MAKGLFQLSVTLIIMGVLLFWPAGTLAYPGGWALIAIFGGGGLLVIIWLARRDPRLLAERMASPIQPDQKPWDRIWLVSFIIAFIGWIPFMGWDAGRTGLIAVPPWLQAIGGLAIAANMLGTAWTFRENSFAAPVVKIQADQKAIDTGPYAFVRHPMYTSAILLFLGMPLLLGSWFGLAPALLFCVAIGWRAVHEERALADELAGYRDYAARVRYRLIPYIW